MWINYTCPKCQRESKPTPLLFDSVGAATLSGKGIRRDCSYDHDAYPMDVVIATDERHSEWAESNILPTNEVIPERQWYRVNSVIFTSWEN